MGTGSRLGASLVTGRPYMVNGGLTECIEQRCAIITVTSMPGMMRKLPQFMGKLFHALMCFLLDVDDEPEWHAADREESVVTPPGPMLAHNRLRELSTRAAVPESRLTRNSFV